MSWVEKKDYSNSDYYNAEWFLEAWKGVQENPATSCLTSCFVHFLAKARSGEWGTREEGIATILLRQGISEEEQKEIIPDLLDLFRTGKVDPLYYLQGSLVGYIERLRTKVFNKQEFSQDEQLLTSMLILVGVSDERIKKIEQELFSKEL